MTRRDDPAPLDAYERQQAQREFLRDYGAPEASDGSWGWLRCVAIVAVVLLGAGGLGLWAFARWAREYSDIQVF